jgi:hypothetical protein
MGGAVVLLIILQDSIVSPGAAHALPPLVFESRVISQADLLPAEAALPLLALQHQL